MIASSPLVKAAALSAALAAHAGLAVVLGAQPGPQMEGAADGVDLRLGSSFADLSAGHLVPQVTPVAAAARAVAGQAAAVRPQMAEATPETTVAAMRPAGAATAAGVPAAVAAPVDPAPVMVPAPALAPEARRPGAEPATPQASRQASPAPAPARLSGQVTPGAAPERSPRPQARAAAALRDPDPAPTRATAAPPMGSGAQSARAGEARGRAQGSARSAGAGQTAQAGANADVTNYPGAVMARLSRVRRPAIAARGSASVAFSVAGDGGLASVRIARGSGSDALDRAALQLVQRAAPFPAPPPGAQRSFTVSVAGR